MSDGRLGWEEVWRSAWHEQHLSGKEEERDWEESEERERDSKESAEDKQEQERGGIAKPTSRKRLK